MLMINNIFMYLFCGQYSFQIVTPVIILLILILYIIDLKQYY